MMIGNGYVRKMTEYFRTCMVTTSTLGLDAPILHSASALLIVPWRYARVLVISLGSSNTTNNTLLSCRPFERISR